jgi:hypothetical protein
MSEIECNCYEEYVELWGENEIYDPLSALQLLIGLVPQPLEILDIPIRDNGISQSPIMLDYIQALCVPFGYQKFGISEFNQYSRLGYEFLVEEIKRIEKHFCTAEGNRQIDGVNIEAAVCCVFQLNEFNREINKLYSLWCKEKQGESNHPLLYYLEWVLSNGFAVPWLEWAINKFPHLVSGKVFHYYYKRPDNVPKRLLFRKNWKRKECPVCHYWKSLHPMDGISFHGGKGCPVCETWLEVIPVDILAAFTLWNVAKNEKDRVEGRSGPANERVKNEKIKAAMIEHFSNNFKSMGYRKFQSKVLERVLTLANFSKYSDRSGDRTLRQKSEEIRRALFSAGNYPKEILQKDRMMNECRFSEYPFEMDVAFTLCLSLPDKEDLPDRYNLQNGRRAVASSSKMKIMGGVQERYPNLKYETVSRISTALLSLRDD